MGHMPIDGADGSLAASAGWLDDASMCTSTIPIRSWSMDRPSACRRARGWEIAEDGMEIVL